jgi:hypothetical protein
MGSIYMRKDKARAVKLRKKGFSYNEISSKLGIPKSTLSYWLLSVDLSREARERISARVSKGSLIGLIRRNKNQTILAQKRADEIRRDAKIEALGLLKNRLFLAGTSLYWAEGYKKGAQGSKWKAVDFANSDPDLVKIMMKFFRNICKVDNSKIKIQLIAHKNIDANKAIAFWSNLVRIPQKQFIKTCCAVSTHSKGRRNRNSLTHGTVHIRINDVKLFFRIIGWIDGLKSKI